MAKGKALLAKVRKALASKRGGAYKRKTTSLVKRNITNNPKDWFAGRSKIFGPMPASMGVRQTFQSDPRYDPTNVSGMSQTAGLVYQSYQFLLLTDMSLRTKRTWSIPILMLIGTILAISISVAFTRSSNTR